MAAEVSTEVTMDKITALAKNRGFIFPGSEIYGGLANTWDYGPLGVELKNNINQMLPQIVQSITDEVTQKFQEEINRLKQRINDLESRNANLSAQSVSIVSKNTKTVLSEDEMDDIDFLGFHVNGWIYYQNERQGNFLYKVREDGTENIQLTDYSIYSNHFTVKDGYLYFNTDAFNTSKIKL